MAEHSSDITLITTINGVISWASPALEQHLGADTHALLGRNAHDLVHPSDQSSLHEAIGILPSTTVATVACRLPHHSDVWHWHTITLADRRNDPAVGGVIWNAHDTTLERMYATHPVHDTRRDPLTQLPTRALMLELGDAALARAQRSGTHMAMLLIDLDRFKVVNDSAGHATGDLLLATVGHRLLECTRAGDSLARMGGDEFAIVLEHLSDTADVLLIARRVLEALREPVIAGTAEIWASASIGIAVSLPARDDHATPQTFGDLLRQADIALHQSKANGGAGYVQYDDAMDIPWRQRLGLESDLQHAVARNELRLAFQPEVDTATGRIVSLEALVRWMHPQHGLLPPDRFIPMAEETGQIVALGDWVLQEACYALHTWRQRYPEAQLRVSVNLSTRQLEQPDFIARVSDILQRTGTSADDLCFELTESCFVQDGGIPGKTLQELHALGFHLAIDDFGIGYSSLAYLTRLRAQVLKIDRSFIAASGLSNGTEAVVSAIVTLAHALNMTVTAEGIETEEHRALVQAVGCDRSQGYHFSRPRPAMEIDDLLRGTPPWKQTAAGAASVSCVHQHLHEEPIR